MNYGKPGQWFTINYVGTTPLNAVQTVDVEMEANHLTEMKDASGRELKRKTIQQIEILSKTNVGYVTSGFTTLPTNIPTTSGYVLKAVGNGSLIWVDPNTNKKCSSDIP